MCLPRPVLCIILMITSIAYWEAECQSCRQGDTCYIPEEDEEAIGGCEPFVYSVGSSLLLSCNSSSTTIVADNITNLEWLKDGNSLDTRGLFFSKKNLSFNDSGNYTCRLSGETISSYKVLVGGKPHTIQQPTCISRIWGQYTCSWDKGSNFNLATRFQLKFCYQFGDEFETCRDTTGTNSCKIDVPTGMKKAGYHVFICAENCLGWAESSLLQIDPLDDNVLTPFPPSNVTLVPIGSKRMNVTFDLPEGWVGHRIGFYIYYTQSCTGYEKEVKEIRIKMESYQYSRVWKVLDVTDKPYSKVCISMVSYFGDNKPTEYSDLICEHTLMARPSAIPNNFMDHFVDDDDGRSLNFTWEELDSCESHGIIRWYILNLTSKTYSNSFKILGNLTSLIVGGLSRYEDYQAELYAVNDIGVSDKAVITISAVPDEIGWSVVLIIVFISFLFLCVITSSFRLYFKVKKRVLPHIPEPSYYNNSFMTQMQYSQLLEPEVFDELRPCDKSDERAQTSNSGEIPLISATTASQESDTHYPYSRFGSSFDSSPRTGSRDFAGLQAARPGNVQHNTYTSHPGSTSTPPTMEDGTSDMSDRKNPEFAGDKESPYAGLDPYARFALVSEDEVFIDERETASHHDECNEGDGYRGDGTDPLLTDSRTLLYSSVTEVSADDGEDSPSMIETNSTQRASPSETLKEIGNDSPQSDTSLSLKNIPNDGKPSLTASPYQPRRDVIIPCHTSPCGKLLTPGNEQMHSSLGNESEISYSDIVNAQQSINGASRQPSGGPYHPHFNVTDKSGFETEENVNSLSYVPVSTGSKFIDPVEQSESFSVQNNESDTQGGDPYVTHTKQIAGSKSSDRTVKTEAIADPCNTDLLPQKDPYMPHPSTVSETLQISPHISHDSGVDRYNMNSNQALQPDPYVSQESAATGSALPNVSPCDPLKPDPYVSHESAVTGPGQVDPSLQDPYVSQESATTRSVLPIVSSCDPLQPDPYVSHESAVTGSGQVNPSSQDPYVSQDSVANGPKTKSCQGLQPDPYVPHESAGTGSRQVDPSSQDPYVSQELAATRSALPNVSSCDPLQPDPYVSHESAVTGSGQVNSSSQDPYVSQDSVANGPKTKSCQGLQPDPYVPHESAGTGSRQVDPSSQDPYVSQELAATRSALPNVSSCDPLQPDPYVSQESAANRSALPNVSSCDPLQPDPYVSHESAVTGPGQVDPSSQDPYVSQESAATRSALPNVSPCDPLQPDPYVSHGSAATGSGQFNSSSQDPYVSQDSIASELMSQSCHAPQPGPYVSHESATARLVNDNPSSDDDPYIPHELGAPGSSANTCQASQPDNPHNSHGSATSMSSQFNPSSKDQGIFLKSGDSRPDTQSCQAVQSDPYISHDSTAVGQMPQSPSSRDDPYISHLSDGGGSNTNTCQVQHPDPYISHESAAAVPMPLNPTSNHDPYISHSSVGGGSNTSNHQSLQLDPYISHESVAAVPSYPNLTSEDGPHTPVEVDQITILAK